MSKEIKSVGIREFRDKASQYFASTEVLAVKRHGKLVGFYFPVQQSDEIEIEQALQKLSQSIELAMKESDLDEDVLSHALNLSQKQ